MQLFLLDMLHEFLSPYLVRVEVAGQEEHAPLPTVVQGGGGGLA